MSIPLHDLIVSHTNFFFFFNFSADMLGTSCDQLWSMVQYSFMSMETRRLVRTDSPGQPPRLSHNFSLSFIQFPCKYQNNQEGLQFSKWYNSKIPKMQLKTWFHGRGWNKLYGLSNDNKIGGMKQKMERAKYPKTQKAKQQTNVTSHGTVSLV